MPKLNLRRLVTTAHGLETLKREKVIQNCIGQFHMQKEKKRREARTNISKKTHYFIVELENNLITPKDAILHLSKASMWSFANFIF